MKEERLRILQMVRDQTLTAAEAAALLSALDASLPAAEPERSGQPRWVRIQVLDPHSNRAKANVTLPLSLVDFGLKMGGKWGGIDADELRSALATADRGRVLVASEGESGERVEIFLE